MTPSQDSSTSTGYLNAADAAALDAELMSSPGFSLEQLMELAGLSVAEAVYQLVPPPPGKILLVCGPGNNGGDGLVAARHLVMFGYDSVVVYPKQSSKQHFINLVQQCRNVGIPILEEMPMLLAHDVGEDGFSAIVDSIFGFSFHGTLREPFATIMGQIKEAQYTLKIPTLSVDIPSGWNVNGGDEAETGFVPDALISLTAPKLAAKSFQGRHFVGGRFLTPKLAEKYNIKVWLQRVQMNCYFLSEKCAVWVPNLFAYCLSFGPLTDASISWSKSSNGSEQSEGMIWEEQS
jgi:NAD(P)H-hydrate epimerase